MAYLIVRHKVADYEKWRPQFDQHGATRQASGSKGGKVFRSAGDPNEIVLVFEWDSVQNAQAFAQSADLRETMEKAGVVDMPTLLFLEEIGAVPA